MAWDLDCDVGITSMCLYIYIYIHTQTFLCNIPQAEGRGGGISMHAYCYQFCVGDSGMRCGSIVVKGFQGVLVFVLFRLFFASSRSLLVF